MICLSFKSGRAGNRLWGRLQVDIALSCIFDRLAKVQVMDLVEQTVVEGLLGVPSPDKADIYSQSWFLTQI